MNMNKKTLIVLFLFAIVAVGIGFFIGSIFQEPTIKIKDIQDIKELKITTAFICNSSPTGWVFYQLDDPKKIKEALINCDPKQYPFNAIQKLVLVFYGKKGQYKILEIPFEVRNRDFFCKYGTSEELKSLLKEIPDPFAIEGWDPTQSSDSNGINTPLQENR